MYLFILLAIFSMTVGEEDFQLRLFCERLDDSICDSKIEHSCGCLGVLQDVFPFSDIRTCIPRVWRCDGWKDCLHGEDEVGCICPTGHLQCGCDRGGGCKNIKDDYACVPPSKIGNGEEDCMNAKDEIYLCKINETVIKHCDGVIYCNGTYPAETICTAECPTDKPNRCDCNKYGIYECPRSNLQTVPPSCYSDEERCDGYVHCSDGSDEFGCGAICPWQRPKRCPCNQVGNFTCSETDSVCYSDYDRCDGYIRCSDGADEWGCEDCPSIRPNRCQCNQVGNFTCSGTGSVCYADYDRCNGISVCTDESDEWECVDCQHDKPNRCQCNQIGNFTCSMTGRTCYSDRKRCDGWIDCSDGSDEWGCTNCPSYIPNRCQCNQVGNFTCSGIGSVCYANRHRCRGLNRCTDGSDGWACENCTLRGLNWCHCNQVGNFTCSSKIDGCYSNSDRCDGYAHCSDGSDERECVDSCSRRDPIRCQCNQVGNYTCSGRGRVCFSNRKRCDSIITCPDGSDEWECEQCPSYKPNRCSCNQVGNFTCPGKTYESVCYSNSERCDGGPDCADASDEIYCPCPLDEQFRCKCSKTNPVCADAKFCISLQKVHDGKQDCADGSDEDIHDIKFQCGACDVTMRRYDNINQCKLIGLPLCDVNTCVSVNLVNSSVHDRNATHVFCLSHCDIANASYTCNIFQCADGSFRLTNHFCNDISECPDGSDELKNEAGFKCKGEKHTCVLPQANLYDGIAQCSDKSDLLTNHGSSHFQCFDKCLVISTKQVCDGIPDCYDMSDECLCQNKLNDDFCASLFPHSSAFNLKCLETNPSTDNQTDISEAERCSPQWKFTTTSSCVTKNGFITPTECNGEPECRDFSDECNEKCTNRPDFCENFCYSFYPLGDRYCDGEIDQAWKYINDSRCPEGFDEANC